MKRREFLRATAGATAALTLTQAGCLSDPFGQKPAGYVYDDIFLQHDPGETHAESPTRISAVRDLIGHRDWAGAVLSLRPEPADLDTVALVHTREYIDLVERECASGATRLSTGDTNISPASFHVALTGAGAVVGAVDRVMAGDVKNAFCAVRPPGHHASAERGMGFCLFNNVAIAARYVQATYGVERVLIADWDVHHGNGTQDTFYADGTVFFMSTHQSPLYPGTGAIEEAGEGPGAGLTMNRPFPPGAGDAEIVGAFRDDLLPAAREFRPEFTLVSAGFDSRVDDRLGSFTVTDEGFRELTRIMLEIANIEGGGRLVSVLEGGYTPAGLASATLAHLEELSLA